MIKPLDSNGILFLSTYPPVKCGIASFTQDLINAIDEASAESIPLSVCALNKKAASAVYGSPVTMVMDSEALSSYAKAAEAINENPSIGLVCIEHEFGLYGGAFGEYLLSFLERLEKPYVIRFHTVLPMPDPKRLMVVRKMADLAAKVIVMTKNSSRLLKTDYAVADDKIVIIPHGTHPNSEYSANALKHKYDLDEKLVLTTFGLLSPNKGIETGIKAMKAISQKVPNAVYLVLGLTHPNLLKQEGEKYRNYLQGLIDENGLQDNVKLVNEYIPTAVLMEYLAMTDIYLFTSKDPNQAVSGTFLYAMSAGCPIISNSFVLASEMLDEKTGVTLATNSDAELAERAISLLQDHSLREEMRRHAFWRTRDMAWNKVAEKHIELFHDILEQPLQHAQLASDVLS